MLIIPNNLFNFLGYTEPLTVKFADGGNKKKNQYPPRQWVDRPQEVYTYMLVTTTAEFVGHGSIESLCVGTLSGFID